MIDRNSSNLERLRDLVDNLENVHDINEEDYSKILEDIGNLINKEKKVINRLRKPDNKLKHYEGICVAILAMINSTSNV